MQGRQRGWRVSSILARLVAALWSAGFSSGAAAAKRHLSLVTGGPPRSGRGKTDFPDHGARENGAAVILVLTRNPAKVRRGSEICLAPR